MTTLTDLPYDVLKYIFTFFKPAEAIQQVSTCSFFKKCFEDNSCSIWETYSRREFGDDFVKKFSDIANEIGWKEFYEKHFVFIKKRMPEILPKVKWRFEEIDDNLKGKNKRAWAWLLSCSSCFSIDVVDWQSKEQPFYETYKYLVLDNLVTDLEFLDNYCLEEDFDLPMGRLKKFCSLYPSHKDKLLHNLVRHELFLSNHFMKSNNAEKNLEKFRKTYPDYEKELLSQIAEIRRAGHENFCSSIDKAPQH